jgi:hypothetical protein
VVDDHVGRVAERFGDLDAGDLGQALILRARGAFQAKPGDACVIGQRERGAGAVEARVDELRPVVDVLGDNRAA